MQHMINYDILKIFKKITNNQKASKKNQLAAVSLNREKTLIRFLISSFSLSPFEGKYYTLELYKRK